MALDLQNAVGRQYPLVARQKFTYEDLTNGEAEKALDIPGGAIVTGGGLVVTEAFDSGTSDAVNIGDGNDTTRYADGVDVQSVGRTALTLDGHKYSAPDTVDIILNSTDGPPSAGEGYLYVEYIMADRAHEVQPAST